MMPFSRAERGASQARQVIPPAVIYAAVPSSPACLHEHDDGEGPSRFRHTSFHIRNGGRAHTAERKATKRPPPPQKNTLSPSPFRPSLLHLPSTALPRSAPRPPRPAAASAAPTPLSSPPLALSSRLKYSSFHGSNSGLLYWLDDLAKLKTSQPEKL
ncbi:hypothetical protein GUJ93_ZPchr0014g46502 [Zizania palustris]|uniref:Uncharacterized protein n=1 Tax=Zizania palustris TaxID=103762 RepID=A0A8J5TH90_ZIZPA|nr:hypothetical protein GUJ93_ZPchr0014g46502 [Zizania palustris]